MGNLNQIKERHGRDGWKDAVFIALALVLTALSVGSVTARVSGHATPQHWSVTMVENPALAR